ncbi:cytochrome P450 4C1 isoform X1 [Tribolium castaneum]
MEIFNDLKIISNNKLCKRINLDFESCNLIPVTIMIQSTLLLIFIVILSVIIYIWWYQNFSRFFSLLNKVPGPPGYPIIGNIIQFLATPEELFKIDRELGRRFYPIYKEWTLTYGAVNLLHPDDIELVLSNSKYNDKSAIYDFLHCWLGTGLLTSSGTKWQTRRKVLTPAFHFNILQQFLPIFNEETVKLIKNIKNDQPIDVIPPVTQFTLLSIAETSMGVKLDASPKSCDDYKNAIHVFGYALTYRLGRPWLHNPFVFFNLTRLGHLTKKSIKILHDFSRNVIEQKKRTFEGEKRGKRLAMLDLLLLAKHQGADIDDEGIAEEVDTFMFEGHDTTSIAICYTLLLLANHPDIQDELYSELKSVLSDPTQTPSYSDLKQLNLMERCIKESLRIFPSVPFISRLLTEDLTTASGYVIPRGSMAHIHIYDLHNNPEIYPDPKKFDPDRFLPENCQKRHPFAYLPFSAGPRNCIGQKFAMLELKVVLSGILGNFVLEAVDKPKDVTMITDLVLRCKGPIRVKFVPRYKIN